MFVTLGRGLVVVAMMGAAACATSKEEYVTPTGEKAYIVNCGGAFGRWPECFAEARKICGGDYKVISRTEIPRGDTGYMNRSIDFICATA
jgi:hypothetical protein